MLLLLPVSSILLYSLLDLCSCLGETRITTHRQVQNATRGSFSLTMLPAIVGTYFSRPLSYVLISLGSDIPPLCSGTRCTFTVVLMDRCSMICSSNYMFIDFFSANLFIVSFRLARTVKMSCKLIKIFSVVINLF